MRSNFFSISIGRCTGVVEKLHHKTVLATQTASRPPKIDELLLTRILISWAPFRLDIGIAKKNTTHEIVLNRFHLFCHFGSKGREALVDWSSKQTRWLHFLHRRKDYKCFSKSVNFKGYAAAESILKMSLDMKGWNVRLFSWILSKNQTDVQIYLFHFFFFQTKIFLWCFRHHIIWFYLGVLFFTRVLVKESWWKLIDFGILVYFEASYSFVLLYLNNLFGCTLETLKKNFCRFGSKGRKALNSEQTHWLHFLPLRKNYKYLKKKAYFKG